MKKIIIFHHYSTCIGAGLCLFQIAIALKNKYEVVVCLPNYKGDLNSKLLDNGIRTIQLKNIPKSYSHYNGSYKPFLSRQNISDIYLIQTSKNKIIEILKNESPDFVLVNSMTLFWIGKIANKMNIKSICYVRETYCNTLLNVRTNYIKNCLNKYFDKIIFISKYDMNATGKNYDKYVLITDKVDFTLYNKLDKKKVRDELQLPNDKSIILYVGGDNPIKGPMVILKAMKFIKSDAKLVYLQHSSSISKGIKACICRILGKDMSFKVEKYIYDNKLTDKIILRNATDEVQKYFIASDLVVFPNTIAHQARPIYEAGYVKKPIVATDFENVKEFLNPRTGFVFKKNNFIELSMLIDNILNGKVDISDKLLNNYKQTVSNHDYSTLINEIVDIIEKE